jgi:hypothetical protein
MIQMFYEKSVPVILKVCKLITAFALGMSFVAFNAYGLLIELAALDIFAIIVTVLYSIEARRIKTERSYR